MLLIFAAAADIFGFAIIAARVIFALPANNAVPTSALPPATNGALARSVARMVAGRPGLSGVAPLADGAGAFAARMRLADAATTAIDAQYYICHDDRHAAQSGSRLEHCRLPTSP